MPELLQERVEEVGLHFVEINTVVVVGYGETPQVHQKVEERPQDHRGVWSVVVNINTESVDILLLDLFNLKTQINNYLLLDIFLKFSPFFVRPVRPAH